MPRPEQGADPNGCPEVRVGIEGSADARTTRDLARNKSRMLFLGGEEANEIGKNE